MVGLSTWTGRTGRRALIGGIAFPIAMLPIANAPAPAVIAHPAACRPAETPMFVCPIGGKSAVLCAMPAGDVAYRYGKPGKVELEARGLVTAYRGFSGGGERQVSFARGRVRYVLFDGTYRTAFGADGRNDPVNRAGLIVQRDGRTVMRRSCSGDAQMDGRIEKTLPRGAFVAH